jgi:hypothetical protein
MALLTSKELKKRQKPDKKRKPGKIENSPAIQEKIETVECLQKWFHPESTPGSPKNFESFVEIEGMKYKIECKDGIILTDRKKLIEHLKLRGYYFLEEVKKNEEQARNKIRAGLQPVFGF